MLVDVELEQWLRDAEPQLAELYRSLQAHHTRRGKCKNNFMPGHDEAKIIVQASYLLCTKQYLHILSKSLSSLLEGSLSEGAGKYMKIISFANSAWNRYPQSKTKSARAADLQFVRLLFSELSATVMIAAIPCVRCNPGQIHGYGIRHVTQ